MDSFAGDFRVMIHDTMIQSWKHAKTRLLYPFIKFLLVEISV